MSLPRPLAGASFLSFSGSGFTRVLNGFGGTRPGEAFPQGKPWDRQPVSGKLRRKLGVSPGLAAYRGTPPPKPLSTQLVGQALPPAKRSASDQEWAGKSACPTFFHEVSQAAGYGCGTRRGVSV